MRVSMRAMAGRAARRAVAVGAATMVIARAVAVLVVVAGAVAVIAGSGCEAAPSIRISPSRVEKQVRRFLFFEDRSFGPFKVANSGTSPLRVRVCVEDLFQTDDGSAVFVTDGSYQFGAAELVSLEPMEFLLEPGKTQLVKGTVNTGSKRTGGGYCVVFFETQPEPEGTASMATASRVGALVYIVFPGPVQVKGSIDRLDVLIGARRRKRSRAAAKRRRRAHISEGDPPHQDNRRKSGLRWQRVTGQRTALCDPLARRDSVAAPRGQPGKVCAGSHHVSHRYQDCLCRGCAARETQ